MAEPDHSRNTRSSSTFSRPVAPPHHATLSSIPNTSTEPQLRRELGLRDLVLFNIAAVIGIRWLAAAAHTGPVSITLWLLAAGFFFIPSTLAVATLSARFPEEGGIYVWTKQGFGDWHGFLCGWCYWLSNLFYFPNLLLAGVDMAGYALALRSQDLCDLHLPADPLAGTADEHLRPLHRQVEFAPLIWPTSIV